MMIYKQQIASRKDGGEAVLTELSRARSSPESCAMCSMAGFWSMT